MEAGTQLQSPEQLALFDPSVVPADPERRKAVAVSTGYWIRNNEPELYQYVSRALAAGMSYRSIRAKTQLALGTIGAIARDSQSLDTHKESLARTMYLASTLATERMVEEIDTLPAQSLPIVAGAMAQRAMELQAGGQVHIHRQAEPEYRDVQELYAAAPVIDAETVDIIGLSGSAGAAKGDFGPDERPACDETVSDNGNGCSGRQTSSSS
jgi:hypothetical protein